MERLSLSTPMLKQWKDIKRQYPKCIVFFRLGDFYETFGKDAKVTARTLGITLTSRGTGKNRIPLAGVPHHSVDGYLAKMVKAGHHVAICEQIQDPKEAKGLVERAVVRIVTPGTLLESTILDEQSSNYIAAVFQEKDSLGLAFAELSTGELFVEEWQDQDKNRLYHRLEGEIASFSPSEILLADSQHDSSELGTFVRQRVHASISAVLDHHFVYHSANEALRETLGVISLEPFGVEDFPTALSAVGGLLAYLQETQKTVLKNFKTVKVLQKDTHLILDSLTLRNLEILKNMRDNTKQGSLLSVFQNAQTPMGGRLLRNWLVRPLIDVNEISNRHDAVESLVNDTITRKELLSLLRGIADIERILGRVSYRSASPRDIAALRDSLRYIPEIKEALKGLETELMLELTKQIDEHPKLTELLINAIVVTPPQTAKEGRIIAEGYNEEVDSLKEIVSGSQRWLKKFEQKERQRSGLQLKTGYNKVHGYYIEVTKAQLRGKRVPEDWEARQTLVSAQRYISKELKVYERKSLAADEKLKNLEYELYSDILDEVGTNSETLQQTALALGILDVLCLYAETAVLNNYSRPELTSDIILNIRNGRHPVVEKLGGRERFVPNDAFLDSDNTRFLLIFGANMAGKSTFIRQLGLLVIMAQIGSFVPADNALIGIVDRIFTRMGAYDEISRSLTKEGHIDAPGASTFMVEMREVATICHNATERSLILMDEVGRGTGTFDGLALAWTIAEYIHDNLRARSLLSTHYHQLSSLEEEREGIRNYHLAIKETETDLIFLYKVWEGATDKSFGIHCARLAGVPKEIVNRAEHVLQEIERTTEIEIPIFRKKELTGQDSKKSKNISDFLN
jgi:DNA mismatch repair protein MutS